MLRYDLRYDASRYDNLKTFFNNNSQNTPRALWNLVLLILVTVHNFHFLFMLVFKTCIETTLCSFLIILIILLLLLIYHLLL